MNAGVLPEILTDLLHKAATEPYPAVPIAIPKRFRGRIALRADACIGCSLCAVSCPTACIDMVPDEADVPREGKTVHRKRRPIVHLTSCIRCAACEEACPTEPKAIFLSEEKTGAFTQREEVVR